MKRFTLVVEPAEAGNRIDVLVGERIPDLSRNAGQALIRTGHLTCNGKSVKVSHRVMSGDVIEGELALPPAISAAPEEIPLAVVYQDADLAIIDKPAGMVVHPAPGHAGGTLANALAARFPETRAVGPSERPGIVHRLDKDTSGLMMVALNARAHRALQRQIADHTAQRSYLALAAGKVTPAEGTLDAPVGRHPTERTRMAAYGLASRSARTRFRVLDYLDAFSLIEARLETGRTHQIRVHFAATGHPLAGDTTYHGAALPGLDRQFLHAHGLELISPSTAERLNFSSSLPRDLQTVLDRLRRRRDS